jgi:hypothetical protein
MFPQSVSRGARFSRLRWFTTAAACQVAGPPVTDLTGHPANGGFYFQAFDKSVALPVAGYNYNSDWTPLLTGLSPAGMAASLAALVRPCSTPPGVPRQGMLSTTAQNAIAVVGIDIGKNYSTS